MARSDKVAMCIMRYMVPLIFVVEFIAIAALAWSLGGPRWAFGAVAAVALLIMDIHSSLLKINLKVIQFEDFLLPGLAASVAKRHPDSCQKLRSAEWFYHIVIGAGIQRAHLFLLHATCRHHDHRRLRILPDLIQHLHTVHIRQS